MTTPGASLPRRDPASEEKRSRRAKGIWLLPLHRLVWADPKRRTRKLLQFSEVEAEGARDLFRAAELTDDPTLRQRFFAHARDELRHAALFRARGLALRRTLAGAGRDRGWGDGMIAGERGFDDLEIDRENPASLLAFIHLSESAALRSFGAYGAALARDPETKAVMERVGSDEEGHMRYSLVELERIAPQRARRVLWQARLRRLWRAYLRVAVILADSISTLILTALYFILLAPFAWIARRAERKERQGWRQSPEETGGLNMRKEYS